MTKQEIREKLLTAMQRAIGRAIKDFMDDIAEGDVPTDKWVLHSVVISAYALAQKINYPFANILAAHMTMATSRQEAHLLIDAAFDKVENIRSEKNVDKLLS